MKKGFDSSRDAGDPVQTKQWGTRYRPYKLRPDQERIPPEPPTIGSDPRGSQVEWKNRRV